MAKFTKDSRREYLAKKKERQDPNLASALYQTKELQADDPNTTNQKLQECVSLIVAKVRRAIRKDRSTLEKELRLVKDAMAIFKSIRELDLKAVELQMKSKQSQELAQIVLNLNSLPDEQLKLLAKEVLHDNRTEHTSETGDRERPTLHNEQPTQELQELPLGSDTK